MNGAVLTFSGSRGFHYRGSKVDMAASVDINSVAGCASSSTLLSSGAAVLVSLMEQTGQEA